jgi:hypothetical protein
LLNNEIENLEMQEVLENPKRKLELLCPGQKSSVKPFEFSETIFSMKKRFLKQNQKEIKRIANEQTVNNIIETQTYKNAEDRAKA